MSQHIKEYGIVSEEITDKIIDIVKNDESKFTNSMIYSTSTEKKYEDTSLRVSQFKTVVDEDLFNLVSDFVAEINKLDPDYNFSLVKNDITYIKYQKGGFFKQHADYLSYTSNIIQEFTMLICEDADCEGGETIFEMNKYFRYPSKSSITPKHCVVFRKDIKHEGAIVKSGFKNIITTNLIATKKNMKQVLIVTFNDSEKFYAIDTNKIHQFEDCMLSTMIEESDEKFIYFTSQSTYDAFKVIYKIFNSSYIQSNEYLDNKNLIKFHMINIRDLFISDENTIQEGILGESKSTMGPSITSGLILCKNQEELAHLSEQSKKLKLGHIPFQMVFIEGSTTGVSDGGDKYGDDVYKMDPVWASFGDNNNILFVKNITNLLSPSDYEIFKGNLPNEPITEYIPTKDGYVVHDDGLRPMDDVKKGETFYTEYNHKYEENNMVAVEVGDLAFETPLLNCELRMALLDHTDKNVLDSIFEERLHHFLSLGFIKLPKNAPDKKEIVKHTDFSYLDSDGQIQLIEDKLESMISEIAKTNLLERVKKLIPSYSCIIPQSKAILENFCNENVYGNVNIIMVYGLIRV